MSDFDALLADPAFTTTAPPGGQGRHEVTYWRLLTLSAHAGGAAALHKDRARLVEMLAWAGVVDPPVFLAGLVQHAVCYEAMCTLGHSSPYLDAVMEDIDQGRAHGSILVTEVGYGNSHLVCGTVARWHSARREFTLHTPEPGARKFMSNVAGQCVGGRNAIVYARVEDANGLGGVFPFAVRLHDGEQSAEGVRIRALPETAGMPLDYGLVEFDGMRVPAEGWLRDTATLSGDGGVVVDDLDTGARTVRSLAVSANASAVTAAACVAAGRAAVSTGLRLAAQRTTRGRFGEHTPVLEFSTQREALYGALARVWATGVFVDQAVGEFAAGGSQGVRGGSATWAPWVSVSRDGALAKAAAASTLLAACAAVRERSGALGFMAGNRIGAWESLGQVAQAAAGDTLLVRLDAGRQFVEDIGHAVPSGSARAGVDWGRGQTAVELAAVRERTLLQRARQYIERVPPGQRESLQTWNPLLPQLVELADAHTTRRVLEAAAEACDGSGEQRAALHLYRLHAAREGSVWHLENGTLSRSAVSGLSAAWRVAVDQMHAWAPRLVEGLGVPEDRCGAVAAGAKYAETLYAACPEVL